MKKLIALTTFFIFLIVSQAFAGNPLSYPKFQAFNAAGAPLSGGLLDTCIAGTSTPKVAYTDKALTTPATNPIVLDSRGEATFYLSGAYKLFLHTAADVLIWSLDNVSSMGSAVVGTQTYYVDASEADQGAAGTGSSVKDYVDAIGATLNATLVFARSDTSDTTVYTFSTSETIPENIDLVFENGAVLDIDTAITVTIYNPSNIKAQPDQQIKTGAGTISFTTEGTVYPEWWGSEGLDSAIESLTAGGSIVFKGGTYALTAGVSATLAGPQNWVALSPTTIQYTGAEITNMVYLSLAGYKITMRGPIVFDANNDARYGLRIDNFSATMADATDLILEDVKAINAYSTDVITNIGSAGIFIYGGFNKVTLINCGASDISRAAGVGNPGVSGSVGISVTHGGINLYPRQVEIINPYIDTVTSEEADGAGANVDCDGLDVLGPAADANGGLKLDTSLIVTGGRFINCRGRSIKSQMENNVITGPTFIRTASGDKTIASGVEVDFQRGSGVLRDFKCNYSTLTGGGTPFGASFKIVGATCSAVATNGEGAMLIDGGEIIINYPAGSGNMPYFFVPASAAGGLFQSVILNNNTFLGDGRTATFVYGDLSKVKRLTITNNSFTRLASGLVHTTADADACTLIAQNNYVVIAGNQVLWTADAGDPPLLKTPVNNSGLNAVYFAVNGEGVSVADDASYIFARQLSSSIYGIYSLTSNFNDTAQAFFACDTDTQIDLTNGLSTSVVYGNAANPDTDGKLNVWTSDNRINIKNRLGSTRLFSLSAK